MKTLPQALEGLRDLVLLDFGKALRKLPFLSEDRTEHPAIVELLGLPRTSYDLKAEIERFAPPLCDGEKNRFAHQVTPLVLYLTYLQPLARGTQRTTTKLYHTIHIFVN
ncbi:MAG: hypothetical protein NTV02_03010 [Candidatus Zambryskibacteria bacterium]|nr:hypothetical protein [Candidatus Zambryskibacteria bacterium]